MIKHVALVCMLASSSLIGPMIPPMKNTTAKTTGTDFNNDYIFSQAVLVFCGSIMVVHYLHQCLVFIVERYPQKQ